jgi:metallophosphoesterase (TIGR00282 family)
MRLLFIGDIVGEPGVAFVKDALPLLIAHHAVDLVIANAENASGGSGIRPGVFRQLRAAGVDAITLGDHIYKKQEIIPTLLKDESVCKPANFPADAPGREYVIACARDGTRVGVFSLLGRTYMRPVDCPFQAADRVLQALAGNASITVVDMHAEATGDKYLMAHHLKGRVSAVLGTHTHVPTADEQILSGGTAFISDVGMTGPYDSVLGRRVDRVLATTLSFVPSLYDVATGDPRLGGALVDIEPATAQASQIRRLMLDQAGLDWLRAQSPGQLAP